LRINTVNNPIISVDEIAYANKHVGIKSRDGSVCYIIGIRKDIRAKIGKQPGDMVKVTIKRRED